MENNKLFKILLSLPIILLFLYFIPFLGIVLLIVRLFMYKGKKNVPILLIIIGVICLVPYLLGEIFKTINIDTNSVPYLYDVIYSDIYNKNIISYAKTLLTIGIIFLILSYIVNMIFRKLENGIINYIRKEEQIERDVKRENDLKMQEKRERAKNTKVVKCPYCGADNMLTSNTGNCKYCRRTIESK